MSRQCDKVQSGHTECRNFLIDAESTVDGSTGRKFANVVIPRQPEPLSMCYPCLIPLFLLIQEVEKSPYLSCTRMI